MAETVAAGDQAAGRMEEEAKEGDTMAAAILEAEATAVEIEETVREAVEMMVAVAKVAAASAAAG